MIASFSVGKHELTDL